MTDLIEALPPPALRGRLDIADAVIETIARRAAATASSTHRANGLDRLVSHDLPRARVTVTAGHVVATLTVAAKWPTPASAVARGVREVVTERIRECTGLNVARVDVEVHYVPRDTPTHRRSVK